MCNQGGDVGQLGGFGLEKFAPRRGVEEEVAHGERGARGRARVFADQELAAGNLHPRAGALLRGAGHHLHPGDGGDRGQSFAAKAQGGDREQVVARAQLGGGVAFKGQQRVVAHHAAPSSAMRMSLRPPASTSIAMRARAGVERIFQQLFDHRSRPVDDLSGRDLVGHLIGKYVDAAHCPSAL